MSLPNCEPTNYVPENVKKAAREILDVLVKNHLHRLEASRLLFSLSNDVEGQDPEVRISEIRLSFCDD